MKDKGRKLINRIRGINIFQRLLVMFIFATLLPMLFFSIWSYNRNSGVIREKVFVSVSEMLNQICGELNQKIEKIRNDSIEISYMEEIQSVLSNYGSYSSRELNLLKINVTSAMSKKYVFDNVISSIVLYTPDYEKIVAYGEDVFSLDLNEIYREEFLKTCLEKNGKCVFRAINQNDEVSKSNIKRDPSIIVGKVVKQSKTGEVVGYMILQVKEEQFSEIYADSTASMNAQAFILDDRGTVISTAGNYAEIGEIYPHQEVIEQIEINNNGKQNDYIEITMENGRMALLNRTMEQNGWQIDFLIPENYLQTGLSAALFNLVGISVACIALGVIVTFLFSSSVVYPLNKVVDGIEQFEKGNLSVTLDETGSDEITRLARQFNQMARKINNLMEQEKNSERQKRKLEIQALQAQINPHFLANTLNTVTYIAKIRKEETIEKLVNAIIELLRDSMKNDDSFHTVREEIRLIENYITIQDYRLLGKFSVDMMIEPGILDCLMPRFILQPVVENAIIHGIEPLNRRGVISVRGYQADSKIIFMITDNGTGVEKERIQDIFEEHRNDEKQRFSGMGIGNVNKRIQLLMGQEYGLSIRSEKNVFTTVEIRLKMIRKDRDTDVQSVAGR